MLKNHLWCFLKKHLIGDSLKNTSRENTSNKNTVNALHSDLQKQVEGRTCFVTNITSPQSKVSSIASYHHDNHIEDNTSNDMCFDNPKSNTQVLEAVCKGNNYSMSSNPLCIHLKTKQAQYTPLAK